MAEATVVPRPALRVLLALAMPIVLARATQAVISFSDALQVKHLGQSAVAATATGGLNTFAFIVLPMGTVFIVQSFVAQLRGKGELGAVPRFAWYGLAIALVCGLLALAARPAMPSVLGWFDYDPLLRDQMNDYMQVRIVSVGFIIGTEALGNWYSGLGRTKMQMIAGLIAMASNIPLNWIFIDGHLGAPAMGVAGAAFANIIATALGFGFLLVAFLTSGRKIGAGEPGSDAPLSLRELGRVLRFGLPNGINWFFEFTAFQLFVNKVMSHLGTATLAAFNVVLSINMISFMPAFGLATAGAVMAGESIGRGDKDAVWPQLKLTMLAASVWMGTIAAIYLLLARPLLGLFASGADPTVTAAMIDSGTTMLALSACWQLFDAAGLVFAETLRAAGDTAWTAAARTILAWFVFMPVAWLVVRRGGGGAAAAMLCLAGYIALLAVALVWRFRTGAWRRIQLVEPTLV